MASRNIGNLAVLITGNSSGLVNALTDAQKRVAAFQQSANIAANRGNKFFDLKAGNGGLGFSFDATLGKDLQRMYDQLGRAKGRANPLTESARQFSAAWNTSLADLRAQFQKTADLSARSLARTLPGSGAGGNPFSGLAGQKFTSSLTPMMDRLKDWRAQRAAAFAEWRADLGRTLTATRDRFAGIYRALSGARPGGAVGNKFSWMGVAGGAGGGQALKLFGELGLQAGSAFVGGVGRVVSVFGRVAGAGGAVFGAIGSAVGAVVGQIGGMFGYLIGLAGTAGTAIKHMVTQAMEFQDLLVGFKVMTGSAAAGREMLTQLEKFASTLPFESAHVLRAARTLAGNGVTMTNVLPALNAIASVVAGTGGGNEKFDNMVLAFSQVMSMGRLMGQELRQLNDAGFTIDLIAKSLKVTAGEVRGLMEAGKISSGDIANAFNMAIAEGGRFYKLLEEQAATPRGQIRRLGSELAITSRGIGEGFISLMQESGVLDFMMGAVKSVQTHLPTIKAKLAEFGGYLKGWVLSAAGAVASAFENLAPIADGINRFLVRPLIIGVGLIYGAVTGVLKQIGKLFSVLSSVWKMPDITGAFGAVLPAEFKAVLDATDVSFTDMAARTREFSNGLGESLDRLGAVGRAAFTARTEIGAIAVPRSLPGDLKEVIDNIRKAGLEGANPAEKLFKDMQRIRDAANFFPMPAFAREHAANLNELVQARYGPGAMTLSAEDEQMAMAKVLLDFERTMEKVTHELPNAMQRGTVEAASTINKAMASQQGNQSVQERIATVLERAKTVAEESKRELQAIGRALGAAPAMMIPP